MTLQHPGVIGVVIAEEGFAPVVHGMHRPPGGMFFVPDGFRMGRKNLRHIMGATVHMGTHPQEIEQADGAVRTGRTGLIMNTDGTPEHVHRLPGITHNSVMRSCGKKRTKRQCQCR